MRGGRLRVGPLAVAVALALALVAAGVQPRFAQPRQPPEAIGPLLFRFNGRDLTDFTTYLKDHKGRDPQGVFAVEDGCLRISGAEYGGITTVGSFRDYHLVVEWRWDGPTHLPRRWAARNSGVLVHATGLEGDGLGAWMAAYESQLIEGGTGDLLIVPAPARPTRTLRAPVRTGRGGQMYYQPGGDPVTRRAGRLNWWGRDPAWRDIAWFRGPDDLENPVGAWNRTEIVADGDRLTVFLNGRVVNAADQLSVTSGRIQFQSEGAALRFRRIEVHALGQKATATAAGPSRPASMRPVQSKTQKPLGALS